MNNEQYGLYDANYTFTNACQTIASWYSTLWDRHFADDICKCISWMKMYEFRLKFHCSLYLRLQSTIFQHWFRRWLGADQATSHCQNQWWLDYRHIYVSLVQRYIIVVIFHHFYICPIFNKILKILSGFHLWPLIAAIIFDWRILSV